MSDPVSHARQQLVVPRGCILGLATGNYYGMVFDASAGAALYVARAVNISRLKLLWAIFARHSSPALSAHH
ncbi:putative holin [Enterobacter quasiroggenkampii]|uniref:putative holin n=1 Tax=Enterobacter quasiroggenkampii TaxID=2497436 RepID=UPI0030B91536